MIKSNRIEKYIFLTILGFVILAIGAIIAKNTRDMEGILGIIPYLMIGIGSGIFGQNLGSSIQIYTMRKNPDEAKRRAIDENDERNIVIRDKAKAKAYDLMLYVYGALMLAFALTDVDFIIIITYVIAYLFISVSNIYYITRFQKEL
jgi:hypothetical protein